MTVQDELELSFYEDIGPHDKDGRMRLVRDNRDSRIFVKKIRSVYDRAVYLWLFAHPVPGIPRIRLLVENEGKLILIEEHVDGTTLDNITRQFPDGISEVYIVKWMRQLIAIMKQFHGANPPIIHRDLKPENIVISAADDLYLVDCNTARQYTGNADRDTRLLGTAGYAAPEQYGFGESDQRTDLYAFGMLLNHLLTGELSRQLVAPGKWEGLIRKCLELDPINRYQNVTELERAFETVLRDDDAGKRTKRMEDTGKRSLKERTEKEPDGLFPDGKGDWRLPGFRGAGRKVRILAGIGYALLAIMFISIIMDSVKSGVREIFANGVMMTLAFLLPILYLGDYHGLQHVLPGARSQRKVVRIIMLCIWTVVLYLSCAAVATLIENV